MAALTITEALADLKTIGKRIEKKQEYVGLYLARQDGLKDPLEKDGGSAEVIKRERQAIADLQRRHVAIRVAIQQINQTTSIVVNGSTRTIAEWLTWRKEIAPGAQAFVTKMRATVQNLRSQAQTKGWAARAKDETAQQPTDLLINIDEAALAAEAENFEVTLGGLDGKLSLMNAITMIDV